MTSGEHTSTNAPRIPDTFHFVYGLRPQTEPFPLMHFLALASCRAFHPEHRIVVHLREQPWGQWWDRILPRVEIRQLGPKEGSQAWDRSGSFADYRYAHESDLVRLEILAAEGGYYADIDSIFVAKVPSDWATRSFVMGHERAPDGAPGSLCNAWIGSASGAPFGTLWLDRIDAAFDGSWSHHSTVLPYLLSQEYPDLISIEPEDRFFAMDWTREGIADLFLRTVPLPDGAVSLHLWEHLWGARDRTDFSHFHSGRITPDYVAFAASTYARLARPHLPSDVPVSRARYRQQQLDGAAFRVANVWRRTGRAHRVSP